MENKDLNSVIEGLWRLPPIFHRKLEKDLLKGVLQQFGSDIAPHHLMIMNELKESGTLCSTEISDAISIAKPQMTRSIDRLIKLGVVEREHDKNDRRKINIKLTDKGKNTMDNLDNITKDIVSEKLSVLSKEDLRRLAGSVNSMAEIFARL